MYNNKQNVASHGKTSHKLYFESKKESKVNQSKNIKIRLTRTVNNFYRYDNSVKKIELIKK